MTGSRPIPTSPPFFPVRGVREGFVAREASHLPVWGFDQGAAEAYFLYAAGAAAGRNAAMAGGSPPAAESLPNAPDA